MLTPPKHPFRSGDGVEADDHQLLKDKILQGSIPSEMLCTVEFRARDLILKVWAAYMRAYLGPKQFFTIVFGTESCWEARHWKDQGTSVLFTNVSKHISLLLLATNLPQILGGGGCET